MVSKDIHQNITKRIEKLMEKCLKSGESPMTEDYRPELDDSSLLEGSEVAKYQMLIACLSWIITLARFVSITLHPHWLSMLHAQEKDISRQHYEFWGI